MTLQFIGEAGIYLPAIDAIKFTALTAGSHIDCYATRSALTAVGCALEDPPRRLLQKFEENRLSMEIAAIIKYRRSTQVLTAVRIEAQDLRPLEPSAVRSAARPGIMQIHTAAVQVGGRR
jgi:hypothetical protein